MVEKTQEQPRLKRLREIEAAMLAKFQAQDLYSVEAPTNYHEMTLEEKNKGKYFATFPYPYMNGHLHLGKNCVFMLRSWLLNE